MDQLTSLRVFRAVVDAGSFVAAAERLGLSSPMVSKHLSQLERQLGVRLLHRSSRRLTLTDAGAEYHARCGAALDLLDQAAADVGRAATEPMGTLKVSAPVWCATDRFAHVLAAYRRQHPAVTLDLHLDNRRVDLVAEGFDLALRATNEPAASLIARPLCDVPFVLVATPAVAAEAMARRSRDATAQVDAILPNYLHTDRLAAQTPNSPLAHLKPAMRSNDTTLTRQATLAGVGLAMLPAWLVESDLQAGRLVTVTWSGNDASPTSESDRPLFMATLFAVYTSRKQLPPKLRTFIDHLSASLGDTAAR